MARPLNRSSSVQVWPAFTDAMLAFVLVLVLMLTFQVARNIDIAGPDQLNILRDQRTVQTLIDSLGYDNVEVVWNVGRQDITFGSEVLFESGSADLNPDGQRLLTSLAASISGTGLSTLTEIGVSGHTDDVGTDTRRFPTNWELSTARATQVVRALAESGINPDSVRLSATGFGEFSPVRPNDSEAGRAENRRIQLRLFYGTGQVSERDSSVVL